VAESREHSFDELIGVIGLGVRGSRDVWMILLFHRLPSPPWVRAGRQDPLAAGTPMLPHAEFGEHGKSARQSITAMREFAAAPAFARPEQTYPDREGMSNPASATAPVKHDIRSERGTMRASSIWRFQPNRQRRRGGADHPAVARRLIASGPAPFAGDNEDGDPLPQFA
jgi:hypothetical protein